MQFICQKIALFSQFLYTGLLPTSKIDFHILTIDMCNYLDLIKKLKSHTIYSVRYSNY
jgi:hypothetical protein